jgi:hypothetical protein
MPDKGNFYINHMILERKTNNQRFANRLPWSIVSIPESSPSINRNSTSGEKFTNFHHNFMLSLSYLNYSLIYCHLFSGSGLSGFLQRTDGNPCQTECMI